ncbi:MAG: hypothetical protein K8S98_15050 [Planctomycetes bacterium]|nr:hypothetical protein [Planctomycetota bacterium]
MSSFAARFARALLVIACLCAFARGAAQSNAPTSVANDALETSLATSKTRAAAFPAEDELWQQLQPGAESLLQRTSDALAKNRRSLALLTYSYAFENLTAMAFVREHAVARTDFAELEKLWTEAGRTLGADSAKSLRARTAAIRPALARAIAEASLYKIDVYRNASLEYAKSTTPESGLYYLGLAYAERDLVELCARTSAPDAKPSPPARSLAPELERLDAELIAVYRPPLSIDRHPEFITIAGTLKEARELNDASLFHGALLRYEQTRQRFAGFGATATAAEIETRVRAAVARLDTLPFDHTIATAFRERADEALEAGTLDVATLAVAALDAYVAALASPLPSLAATQPELTVTLVRWPYT